MQTYRVVSERQRSIERVLPRTPHSTGYCVAIAENDSAAESRTRFAPRPVVHDVFHVFAGCPGQVVMVTLHLSTDYLRKWSPTGNAYSVPIAIPAVCAYLLAAVTLELSRDSVSQSHTLYDTFP